MIEVRFEKTSEGAEQLARFLSSYEGKSFEVVTISDAWVVKI